MKKGEEMGKAVAKPIARFVRAADAGAPWPAPQALPVTPFFNVSVKSTTKKFEVVAGATTVANGSVVFTIRKWTGGVSTPIASVALGAWSAGLPVTISTDEVALIEDDVLTIEATNTGVLLPSLMFVVTIEVG
jgi:hypothetical protein